MLTPPGFRMEAGSSNRSSLMQALQVCGPALQGKKMTIQRRQACTVWQTTRNNTELIPERRIGDYDSKITQGPVSDEAPSGVLHLPESVGIQTDRTSLVAEKSTSGQTAPPPVQVQDQHVSSLISPEHQP